MRISIIHLIIIMLPNKTLILFLGGSIICEIHAGINLDKKGICFLFFTSHQQSFSYKGTGLPGLNQHYILKLGLMFLLKDTTQ